MGRWAGAGLLCLVGLAVGAGAAWACVPQPMLLVEPQASARPGETLMVRGLNFDRKAEIRFNGVSGPLLSSPSGERFKAKVKVPRAPGGLYTLVALNRDQSGGVSGMASAPLEIAAAGGERRGDSSARPGTAGSGSGQADDGSPDGVSPALAAGGGLTLIALGALTGALLASRRPRSPGSSGPPG